MLGELLMARPDDRLPGGVDLVGHTPGLISNVSPGSVVDSARETPSKVLWSSLRTMTRQGPTEGAAGIAYAR